MSVSVRIPTILRTYTDGASEVEIEPTEPTLAGALDALEAVAPGIRTRVLDDDGKLLMTSTPMAQQLVADIGKEVANRNAVREQQKREIQRLRTTLEEMRTHQKYANEQLELLRDCIAQDVDGIFVIPVYPQRLSQR